MVTQDDSEYSMDYRTYSNLWQTQNYKYLKGGDVVSDLTHTRRSSFQ